MQCSIEVPLGVLAKNENKGDEMVKIMAHLHQYVPAIEFCEDVFVGATEEVVKVQRATALHQMLFGGDYNRQQLGPEEQKRPG